jgi:hypothetical protein
MTEEGAEEIVVYAEEDDLLPCIPHKRSSISAGSLRDLKDFLKEEIEGVTDSNDPPLAPNVLRRAQTLTDGDFTDGRVGKKHHRHHDKGHDKHHTPNKDLHHAPKNHHNGTAPVVGLTRTESMVDLRRFKQVKKDYSLRINVQLTFHIYIYLQ